ncbi:DUF2092 domain-containing protein [Candidatus Moduliflexota bacterium]
MRKNNSRGVAAVLLAAVLVLPAAVTAGGDNQGALDPLVDSILRQSCSTLAEAGEFSFHAEIAYDEILHTGQKVQYAGQLEAALKRPDRIRTNYRGDRSESAVWYDGSSFTLMDPAMNLFASAPAPANIDALLELTVAKLGFNLPLSDFFYSDPYTGLLKKVTGAIYAGLDTVDGAACHHLAFSQEDIDWQVWIEEGDRPVPRKLIITYKNLPGSPQYTAVIRDWNFAPGLADGHFSFEPPAGAERIEFLTEPEEVEKQ